jgi:hypothetical protein
MHSHTILPLHPPQPEDLDPNQDISEAKDEQVADSQANDLTYLDLDTDYAAGDAFYNQLGNGNNYDENKENNVAEEIAEDRHQADHLPDDEIDLEELLAGMQAKTRFEKIFLLYTTIFSIVGPLLFFTGAVQFPAQFEEFLESLKELLWFTCRFTSEDIDAIAYDGTVVRLEAIRYTTTSAFLAILVATVGVLYQTAKKCWKRSLTNELVELLEEKNVKNAQILRSYEFSSEIMHSMIQSIRVNGVRKELLEVMREDPSRPEKIARNIASYQKEVKRYFKILLVGFAFPGLIIWMQKGDSLSEKIDCDKSTVVFDTCPADKQYAHLALLVYPWMTASFGALATLSLAMVAYFTVPKRVGQKFNEKIHQRILKFLSLRDEDKDKWAHREFVWALGFALSLPVLTWFSVTRAYNTANQFAEISHCPSLALEWLAVIFGMDISTPECTAAKSTLTFGGGIADLEMDKFYPLYTMAEMAFYSLGIFLTTFRRALSVDTINKFLKKYDEAHRTAMKAGAAGVLLVGIPLFYRALNYALPINRDGIIEEERFDNLLFTNSSISFVNMSIAEGINKICPYDSVNFLDQLRKLSIGDLAQSIIYKGNSVFDLIIAKSCPEYASYGGALVLFGLTLGNRVIDCDQSTYIRFYSGFLAVYWSGISITFGALYLPVFYGLLFKWMMSACVNQPDAANARAVIELEQEGAAANDQLEVIVSPEVGRPVAENNLSLPRQEASPRGLERNRFFSLAPAKRDDKKVPLLEGAADNGNLDCLNLLDSDDDLEVAHSSASKKKSSSKKGTFFAWVARHGAAAAARHERGQDMIEMHSSSSSKKAEGPTFA